MADGDAAAAVGHIQPDFSDFLLALDDAERGGEGKISRSDHLDQGTGLPIQVAHRIHESGNVVGQWAEASYRKLLCHTGNGKAEQQSA